MAAKSMPRALIIRCSRQYFTIAFFECAHHQNTKSSHDAADANNLFFDQRFGLMARALYMRWVLNHHRTLIYHPLNWRDLHLMARTRCIAPIPGDTHVDVVGQFLGLATDFEVVEGEVGGGVDAPLTTVGRFHLEEQALNLAKGVEIDKCPVFEGKPL